MNKKKVKQTLLTTSINKIKDLILEDKVDESQAIVETLAAQLKEVDKIYSYIDGMIFEVGDFVTLDDPEAREVININSYRDIGYLNNVYTIIDTYDHYTFLIAIKDRDEVIGHKVVLSPKEAERMTKLNIKNSSVASSLGVKW